MSRVTAALRALLPRCTAAAGRPTVLYREFVTLPAPAALSRLGQKFSRSVNTPTGYNKRREIEDEHARKSQFGPNQATAGDLVDIKKGGAGAEIRTCKPDDLVIEAVREMVKHNIGSLVVTQNEKPVGIVTERDYLEKVVVLGRKSDSTYVKDIMSTKSLVWVTPSATVGYCMDLMAEMSVTHIPVIEQNKLRGVISMGDVVKDLVKYFHEQQKVMSDFIAGSTY
ncbi:CBS domain-containing protein CBSX3, mitochondrial [Porphyridium purpureum]|uniref:CBS domain-containing protein CBSX3, mitochondrial n=1 Tax=Porphyridium purpureum TaxID=35688 RepID=A0A5J4Z2J7_PORPP|nr:CBS domain-containing protein CBSX3, mitochondrial [Porphyridium purpureum]|eukprot:POR8981..scf295_1